MPLRDWFGDVLTQISARDSKRQALAVRVQAELESADRLLTDPVAAVAMIEAVVRDRIQVFPSIISISASSGHAV